MAIINNTKNTDCDDLPRCSKRKKALSPKVLLERLFLYDFREITADLYILRCQDFTHRLACEMTLERKQRLAFVEDAACDLTGEQCALCEQQRGEGHAECAHEGNSGCPIRV